MAINISDHLRVPDTVDVDLYESNGVSTRLIKKGFRIFDIHWAICFLKSYSQGSDQNHIILT